MKVIQLGRVKQLLIGKSRSYTCPDTFSAINKQPVTSSVKVSVHGLEGDEQADLRVHGGIDKAVHFYPIEYYAYWHAVLKLEHSLPVPGAFGENISTEGITEYSLCLGDKLQIGSVILEITQGRQPCWKLNDRFGVPDMALQVQQSLRTGWYAKVGLPGMLAAGDKILLLERPYPEWPLARMMAILYQGGAFSPELEALLQLPLVASWQRLVEQRIATRTVEDWQQRLFGLS